MNVKTKIALAIIKRDMRILAIWSLGVVAGASGMYWVNTLPTLEENRVFEQVQQITPIETVDTGKGEKVDDGIEEMMAYIYKHESSDGKNNYSKCEEKGKYNGIGYGIDGSGKYVCFNSHDEQMTVLKGWLTYQKATGSSREEMLCLYSGSNYSFCKK